MSYLTSDGKRCDGNGRLESYYDRRDIPESRCWACGKFCAVKDLTVRRDWETGDISDQVCKTCKEIR